MGNHLLLLPDKKLKGVYEEIPIFINSNYFTRFSI